MCREEGCFFFIAAIISREESSLVFWVNWARLLFCGGFCAMITKVCQRARSRTNEYRFTLNCREALIERRADDNQIDHTVDDIIR